MSDLVGHPTIEGDTWYKIADRAYGDSTLTAPLIAANPGVPIGPTIPGGITIYAPVRTEDDNNSTNLDLVPFWKR